MTTTIAGAAGYIGRRLVKSLMAAGLPSEELVLITRSPDRFAPLAPKGAQIRFGDYSVPHSLLAAFKGADRLLLVNTAPESHATWDDNVTAEQMGIRKAAEAGVGHVILQSSLGALETAEPPEADDLRLEQTLKDTGVAWTLLRTGGFADSRGRDCKRVIQTGRLIATDRKLPRAYVTRDDIASVAARVLSTPGHEGQAYSLVGPPVAQADLVALLSEIRGAPVEVVVLDAAAFMRHSVERGRQPGIAARGLRADRRTFDGAPYPPDDIPRLIGRPATSLLELLRANRDELLTGLAAPGREPQFA